MNREQMKMRCPKAIPVGKTILKNYKLVFKGVADIIKCEGAEVPVAVWRITEECEKALDVYEGYPRLYRKEYVDIGIGGKQEIGMVYVMNYGKGSKPSGYYFDVIQQGYEDFGIEPKPLIIALRESMKKA